MAWDSAGTGFPANGPGPAGGKAIGGRGGRERQQQWGSLVGRIGDRGRPFVVGSKYEGIATEDGKLYLGIMSSPYNADPGGPLVRASEIRTLSEGSMVAGAETRD